MKTIKWIVIVMLLVGGAGGAWWWKTRADDAPEYQTATVARGELIQTVTATGQLNPVTNVQVGCQISGTIQQLFADYNSPVTNGQLVAQLDPQTYEANLHQAEGDLASAQAALELAQVNTKRSKELLATKLIPQSDFDQAIATLHQAAATVTVKLAALENARVNLDRCAIYSPVNGVVIARSVDVGQTVAASMNAPVLFQIANDLTKMQIDANVAEGDVGNVAEGQDVTFTVDAFPDRTFQGKVSQVRNSPLTVQNVVTYDTVIAVDNHDLKLKPGMTANVAIIVERQANALKLVNSALRFHPPNAPIPTGNGETGQTGRKHLPTGTHIVYKLDATGNPVAVQVRTGITDGVFTEVLDGLKDGDQVVTSVTTRSASGRSQNPFMPHRF